VQVTAGTEPDAQEASRLILRRSGKMHRKAKLKTAVFEQRIFAQYKLQKKPMPTFDGMGFFYDLPACPRDWQDSSSNH
jgi:hypothetical protein